MQINKDASTAHFACHLRYNEATGLVHHPLQPAGDVPHRRQVRQGLSSTSGRHVGRVGACPERREEAKGSYFNPLAAEMAEWGVLIQVRMHVCEWLTAQSRGMGGMRGKNHRKTGPLQLRVVSITETQEGARLRWGPKQASLENYNL